MFRVKVQYKIDSDEHSVSLIMKTPVTGVIMEEFNAHFNEMYGREPRYYNEYINETYKLFKHDFVPRHYKSPHPLCLVLEDLKAAGYVMADRHKLLDFEHCLVYVKTASKLHALSVVVCKKNPELIKSLELSPDLADKVKHINKAMTTGGLHCMAAYLEGKPDCIDYLDIIKEASEDDNLANMITELDKSKTSVRALIQEDPWCTNMMFKYDPSGKVVGVKMFDFQNFKNTSPVKELILFLWVSANPEVRESKLQDLYQVYCENLNKNLADLECSERLSYEDMKSEIKSLSPLILLILCSMMPICIADDVADISDYITGKIANIPVRESAVYKLYQGTWFNQYYPQMLHCLSKEGVFDHLREQIKHFKSKEQWF